MTTVKKSRLWWLVLAVMMAGTALMVAGCSSEDSPTSPVSPSDSVADLSSDADKAKPTSFTGDVELAPNIWNAPWDLQGMKKARSFHETGTGPALFEDITAGDFEVTWGAVDGFYAPDPATEIGKLKFNQTFTFSTIYTPVKANAVTAFGQDFENLLGVNGWMAGDGWKVYGNVWDGENLLYGYGPFIAPNNLEGPAWCDIVTEQGGPEQGLQQLVVYSDYANADHANGFTIESNIFQEQDIESGAAGTWYFTFDAKMGNLAGGSTALAFIKTLDPNDGWAMTNFITADMTSTPLEWTGYVLELDVTGLDGQILQFGFMNTATNYESSGIYYDNVAFWQ